MRSPRPNRSALRLLAFLVIVCSGAVAEARTVRVVVNKSLAVPQGAEGSPFAPLRTQAPATFGFVEVADYVSRTLFEGPEEMVWDLLRELDADGYAARVAHELDEVTFNGARFEPDGDRRPRSAAAIQDHTERLFILILRGFPTPEWLEDLNFRNVRLIHAIPPASYLARSDRASMASLSGLTTYVRGVSELTPQMKVPQWFGPSDDESLHRVWIAAVEETPEDSLRDFLQAISAEPIASSGSPPRVTYYATLTRRQLYAVTLTSNVYAAAEAGEMRPSSERQGVLIMGKYAGNGTDGLPLNGKRLPAISPDHWQLLKGLSNPRLILSDDDPWSNTTIGVVDTGFDNAISDTADGHPVLSTIHPDLRFTRSDATTGTNIRQFVDAGQALYTCIPPYIMPPNCPPVAPPEVQDRYTHGTLVTSVIGAWTPTGPTGRVDEGVYSWNLGVAPRARLVIEKWLDCAGERNGAFTDSCPPSNPSHPELVNYCGVFWRINQSGLDVVNLSSNDHAPPNCTMYTDRAATLDDMARKHDWLFTVSAGNATEVSCGEVRPPATAKNVLAVGATENDSPASWTNITAGHATICASNVLPPQDAWNIPSFSARGAFGVGYVPPSVVKPDLLAPATRITGAVTRNTNTCTSIFCDNDQSHLAQYTDSDGTGFAYGFSAGTSFAAPAAAGAAAIVRRWYQELTGIANPSPAMTKAILINGARDIFGTTLHNPPGVIDPFPGQTVSHIPDPHQGWGMLNLDRLLGPASNYYFDDHNCPLAMNGFSGRPLVASDSTRQVRITLVWTDPPGPPQTTQAPYGATNNLDLWATDPAGHMWWGNDFVNGESVQLTQQPSNPDRINNVKEIIIPANSLAPGTVLQVNVLAQSVMQNAVPGGQDFALFAENARICTDCRVVIPICARRAPRVALQPRGDSVSGGSQAAATVALGEPAPDGGVFVALTSSDTSAAVVPASATIPKDSISVDVPVTTYPVSNARTVLLTATNSTNSVQALITVWPPTSTVSISAVSPNAGSAVGGNPVTIYGNNLGGATSVSFFQLPAQIIGNTASSVTVTAPQSLTPGSPVAVDVIVRTPNGTATATNGYTFYIPPSVGSVSPNAGSSNGGQSVTISGSFLAGTYSVTFGGASTSFSLAGNTITAVTPPHAAGAVDVVVTNPGGSGKLAGGYTYTALLAAPTNLSASAVTPTQVSVGWAAVSGTHHYELERSSSGTAFGLIASPTSAGFIDTAVYPNTAYLYRVRAVDAGGNRSDYSNLDLATTVLFSDDPIQAGSTVVKAQHILELITAVNAVRSLAGRLPVSWVAPSPGTPITKGVIEDLRNLLTDARAALGFSDPPFTEPVLTPQTSTIKKIHIDELRQRVK